MHISIHDQLGELTEEVKLLIERRLLFALARFDDEISELVVFTFDHAFSPSEIRRNCRLVAKLSNGTSISLSDEDTTIENAISRAANRLSRSVARALIKQREQPTTLPERNSAATPDDSEGF